MVPIRLLPWRQCAAQSVAGLLVALITSGTCRADSPTTGRFRSPQGKFELAFENPNTLVNPDPDKPPVTPGVKTVRYCLSFYKPGSTTDIATTDFYDVRPSTSSTPPVPVADYVKQMLWSPEEDFVVLPKEQWPNAQVAAAASPPGMAVRKAVSLNPDSPWMTSPFPLDEKPLIWPSATLVVGNLREDCHVSVEEFDARTGILVAVSQADLPAGYVIVSGDKNQILMKKILGPCATPEDARTFIPECTYFDLQFDRRHIGACPS
jgi:hypothetical protein